MSVVNINFLWRNDHPEKTRIRQICGCDATRGRVIYYYEDEYAARKKHIYYGDGCYFDEDDRITNLDTGEVLPVGMSAADKIVRIKAWLEETPADIPLDLDDIIL